MKHVNRVEEAVNASTIPSGSRLYCSGNAATPQALLKQLATDGSILDIELLGVLLLGDIEALFCQECCNRITHRVIFNSAQSRFAVNNAWAMYQLLHLSDIPRQLRKHIRPNIVFISVAGPDNGGNFPFVSR